MKKTLSIPSPEALRSLFIRLVQVTTPLALDKAKKMEPDAFLREWVPKLYGINPNEPLYKKACITELLRQVDRIVVYDTVERVWVWEGQQQTYPKYLPVLLAKAHREYQIQEFMGCLPKYSIERASVYR